MVLNVDQQRATAALEARVGNRVREIGINKECAFVEVGGVTVTIGKTGALGFPSLRSYDDGFEAAVNARSFWEKQRRRDQDNPERAQSRITGHLNPIVGPNWKCVGEVECPCWAEADERRRHRGFRKN